MSKGCYHIAAPISVTLDSGKSWQLNLNVYRNAHYFTLNDAKVAFSNVMKESISELPQMEKIEITYTLFPKTKHLYDISNVLSIVDKFFCDALVENRIIEDDNYTIVRKVQFEFGEVDKLNPRAEVEIREV